MAEVIELVKEELSKILKKDITNDFEEIEPKLAKVILENEGLPVYKDLEANLTTPWAVARYIQLSIEEKEFTEKVVKDLSTVLPDNIDILPVKGFTSTVQLTKQFVEGEKKQNLTVKYYMIDDEFYYSIVGTSPYGWDISKRQLASLLSNTTLLPEIIKADEFKLNKKKTKKSWIKRILGL